jgi:hypothetical protein
LLRVATFEFINERVMLMRFLTLGLAAGLAVVLATQVAQATPSRAGNCSYCHTIAAGTLDVTGNQTEETVGPTTYKTYVVEPGGSTQFSIVATAGLTDSFSLILNRLDLLNETIQYSPRLYTPDSTWSFQSRSGSQYLGGQGRYYVKSGVAAGTYLFSLALDPAVKLGFYTIQLRSAGGVPEGDTPDGWNATYTFGLRVGSIPEPATAGLLMLGFVPLITRRYGR